eukprot:CAMPEP_0170564534 /NCGR_PEP_ID=MMETSP0211-20121228/73440_1 /TAXON_ID=311385 /ORGANISM="Pseudokeronopsis sp., Strain OXSARD2" /LENGTH=60 /DNA_ID=CAMNT_0010884119 /DNA_START=199 /DNA_END=378 /DNA_ORIENTATION=+
MKPNTSFNSGPATANLYSLKGNDEIMEREISNEVMRLCRMCAPNHPHNIFKGPIYNRFPP